MTDIIRGAGRAGLAGLLSFLIIAVLSGVFMPASPASAAVLSWSVVDTPSAVGERLQAGSDIDFFAIAPDGVTMFAYDNSTHQLYKSIDAGLNWTTVSVGDGLEGDVDGSGGVPNANDNLVAMAISPEYSEDGRVTAAIKGKVFRSMDWGRTFNEVGTNVGGLIGAGSVITSIAISPWYKGGIAILVGDSDGNQGGGVSLFTSIDLAWVDLKVGYWNGDGTVEDPCDVLAVAFSPEHKTDSAMIAVVTHDVAGTISTEMTTKLGTNAWSADLPNDIIVAGEATSAVIAFPDDYDWSGANRLLVGTSGTNNDDAFRLTGDVIYKNVDVFDLNVNGYSVETDIQSIAFRGDGWGTHTILVGQSGSATIRRCTNITLSTPYWYSAAEALPGSTNVKVVWSPAEDIAYAVSRGLGSALSRSSDKGYTWNQFALIDVSALANLSFRDVAVVDASTFFLLIRDDADASGGVSSGDYSMLFKTSDGGLAWEQIAFHRSISTEAMSILALSPNYTTDRTLFVAQNDKVIWKTSNGGNTFTRMNAPKDITAIEVVNSTTYFTGHADALHKSGRADAALLGGDTAVSIKYVSGGTVFVGTNDGAVLVSTDDGKTFRSLGEMQVLGSNANVLVALDPEYATNKIIYAGSSDAVRGVQVWILDTSTLWKQLDDDNNTLSCVGLAVTGYGAIYAASNAVDKGVRRSVSRTSQKLFINFESMTGGLPSGAKIKDMVAISDLHVLYAVVSSVAAGNFGYPYRLMVFEDAMAVVPQLVSPEDKAVTVGEAVLSWQAIDSPVVLTYKYEVATDVAFANKVMEATTDGTMVTTVGLTAGSQYWWRVFVEAGGPLRSKESAVRSFILQLPAPVLRAPAPGEREVRLKPMFAWLPVDGANSYELEFADNPEFKNATIQKGLTYTVWTWEEDLEYSTNYFWRVRAVKGDGSAQVAGRWLESAFTTISVPHKPVQRVEVEVIELPAPAPEKIDLTQPQVNVEIPAAPPVKQIAPLYIWVIVGLFTLLFIVIIMFVLTTGRKRRF